MPNQIVSGRIEITTSDPLLVSAIARDQNVELHVGDQNKATGMAIRIEIQPPEYEGDTTTLILTFGDSDRRPRSRGIDEDFSDPA